MLRNNHLLLMLPGSAILMATRLSGERESVSFQNGHDLSGGKVRRPSVTQP